MSQVSLVRSHAHLCCYSLSCFTHGIKAHCCSVSLEHGTKGVTSWLQRSGISLLQKVAKCAFGAVAFTLGTTPVDQHQLHQQELPQSHQNLPIIQSQQQKPALSPGPVHVEQHLLTQPKHSHTDVRRPTTQGSEAMLTHTMGHQSVPQRRHASASP